MAISVFLRRAHLLGFLNNFFLWLVHVICIHTCVKSESSMDLNIFYKCLSPQLKQNWVKKAAFLLSPFPGIIYRTTWNCHRWILWGNLSCFYSYFKRRHKTLGHCNCCHDLLLFMICVHLFAVCDGQICVLTFSIVAAVLTRWLLKVSWDFYLDKYRLYS